ncbi:MAG: hypothetical protein GY765_12740 [bacterium]|nr:hypothetical protein [bacterium]
MKRSGHNAEELLHRLFKEREELVPVARNPFSASLISEHAKHNQNSLPENQMEMYDGYIDRALEKCRHRIEKRKLSKEIIVKCAIEIADIMFQKYGLEAPINLIRDEISEYPVEDVVDVLILARLGRSGTGDENRFCFVHQRFTEYFAVQKIINKDRNIEMETIPTASQWRDAMVLYCEVVEESNAIKIAEFCWDIIKTINDPMNKRVLNCMRFLGDAYKCRLGCIQSFRTEFAEYIFKNIGENINMLLVKLAVETLGLFEEKDIDRSIVKVMDIGNPWLNETAFKSCRNLSKISKELEDKLMRYIEPISLTFSFRQRKELNFSLSLSAAFYKLKHFHKYLTYAMVFYITIAITSVTILSRQKFLENAWRIDKKDLELSIGIIWFIIYFILGCYKRIRFLGVQIKYNQILLILKQWTPSIVFLLVAIISAKLDLIWIPILILTSGTVFFASRIIYNIITNSRIIHFEKKRLKQLDIDMYCNRPAIQKAIQSFELDSTKLEFVKLLEVNVTEVSGNWLNSSILYARNNNEYIIRLAKLEEKWLGLNR